MKVLSAAADLAAAGRPVCLAIGMFDGVHLGHQQVIRQAVMDAGRHEGLGVVLTFDRHPARLLAPERAPGMIYPPGRKLAVLAELGVDAIVTMAFTLEFSRQPASAFIRELARDCGWLRSVSVGSSFTFGHQRSGDIGLLRELGRELGFDVNAVGAVALDDRRVSSTRIREAIRGGDFQGAAGLLGREYSLVGPVVPGDQVGRQLGFPTANLGCLDLVMPPHGVYAVHVDVAGRRHRAVLNIGLRPTRTDTAPRLHVEAHLLDFSGDLYGREAAVSFVKFLRGERRFPGLDALKAQIALDVAEARAVFDAVR